MAAEPPRRPEPVVGVSLKMYLGVGRTRRWIADVAQLSRSRSREHAELFVAPSFLSLAEAAGQLAGTAVGLCAQDVFWEDAGAYTGEVSAPMLREVGCRYAEVGHAERRRLFGEDDAVTARKAAAAAAAGLVPVVCIGEPERAGPDDAARACRAQMHPVLAALPPEADAIFAYEPVWAIGAPAPAEPAHVVAVAHRLRAAAAQRPGRTRIVYGGSAGPGSIGPLFEAVDGLFLGRFAHDVANLGAVLDELDAARAAA